MLAEGRLFVFAIVNNQPENEDGLSGMLSNTRELAGIMEIY